MNIAPIAQNINFKGIIPKRFTKRKNEPDIPKYEDCYSPELKGLSVMVPVFGYRSYNNPKSIVINDRYKQVIIQQGKAFCPEDNKGYSGLVLLKNKKNKLVGLNFNEGELTSSYFDKKKEKTYQSLSYIEAMQDANFRRSHKFQDGSALEEEQFFGMDDVTYKKITTKPKGSTTYIKRNNSPKYKGEPVLSVYSDKKHPKLINADGIEKVEFKMLNDAQSYFLAEYGIDVDFIDLKQAHLMKDALDEFAKLNYKGKGKKLFEGLYIGQLPGAPEQQGEFSIKFFYNNPEKEKVPDLKEKDESYFEDHMQVITFNPLYCWDNLEFAERRAEEINLHPSFKATNPMIHEFAHLLHVMDSPKAFYFYAENEPEIEEKPIIQMVSDYATNNVGEFVAEYISGRLAGKTYPKVVDALYKKYGGPDLFSSI